MSFNDSRKQETREGAGALTDSTFDKRHFRMIGLEGNKLLPV